MINIVSGQISLFLLTVISCCFATVGMSEALGMRTSHPGAQAESVLEVWMSVEPGMSGDTDEVSLTHGGREGRGGEHPAAEL